MIRKSLFRSPLFSLLPTVAGHAPHALADAVASAPRFGLRRRFAAFGTGVAAFGTGVAAFGTGVAAAYRRYRQRRALLALSGAMLKDIGLSRADALHEGSKGFWQD